MYFGQFSGQRHGASGARSVLGLVSSKFPELESVDDLLADVARAMVRRYVSLALVADRARLSERLEGTERELEGVQGAMGALGGACGACHKAYRQPDN